MPKNKAERRKKKSIHKKTHPKVDRHRNDVGELVGPGEEGRRRFPLRQKLKRTGGAVSLSTLKARARARMTRERAQRNAEKANRRLKR